MANAGSLNYYYTLLTASFPGQPDLNEARDDGVLGIAVASAGPYANNLHLTPDR